MSDAAERGAGGVTLRGSLARLADALVGLARTRLELATVEFTEERSRITQQLALLLAGVGCVMFALFFAAAAVVVYFWDTNRFLAILGVVGWRHPFAYDRPAGGGLRSFLGMAVRDRILTGAVAILFATSLILFLR